MALQLPLPKDLSKDFRKLLAFGTGIGIEIGADALEVLAARVRPSKVDVLGRLSSRITPSARPPSGALSMPASSSRSGCSTSARPSSCPVAR